MRRLAAIAVTMVALLGAALWLLTPADSGAPEAFEGASAQSELTAPVVRQQVPPRPSLEEALEDVEFDPAKRRRQRFERKQDEAWERLEDMTVEGELTEEEAAALTRITQRTFARAERLMDRRDSGEIGGIGLFLRTIPMRITHTTQVVDTLGRDRAQEVGQLWRDREHEAREVRRQERDGM